MSSFKRSRDTHANRSNASQEAYDSSRSRRNAGSRPTKFFSFAAASSSFPARSHDNVTHGRELQRGGGGGNHFRDRRGSSSSSPSSTERRYGGSVDVGEVDPSDAYRPQVIPPSFSSRGGDAPPSSSPSSWRGRSEKEGEWKSEKRREEHQWQSGRPNDRDHRGREAARSTAAGHAHASSTMATSGMVAAAGKGSPLVRDDQYIKKGVGRSVVVILEHCGLQLGRNGRLVDAYEGCRTTAIKHPSLLWARPDIVHQCLLALFDSELGYQQRLRVYLHLCSPSSAVVEVSPTLRPPRTFARFKGLMTTLLRDGVVLAHHAEDSAASPGRENHFARGMRNSGRGRGRMPSTAFSSSRSNALHSSDSGGRGALLRVLPGSIAPILPEGAPCVGLCNDLAKPVTTTTMLAKEAVTHPVEDGEHQGGLKQVFGFYCISCSEEMTVRLEGSGGHRLHPISSRPGRRGASVSATQRRRPSHDEEDEMEEEEDDEASRVAASFPSSSPSTFVTSPSSVEMMQEVDYLSQTVAPSAYPLPAHVMCARLCEGFWKVISEDEKKENEKKAC